MSPLVLAAAAVAAVALARPQALGLSGHGGGHTWVGWHRGPRRRIYPRAPHNLGRQCLLTTTGWVYFDRDGIAYPCPMPIGYAAPSTLIPVLNRF